MADATTYLAVFLGTPANSKMAAWSALTEAERAERVTAGLAAWHGWVEAHKGAIVELGGPLGKTKKISNAGIEDVSNGLTGYTIVRAHSFDAAAEMFVGHPHFTVFPGDSVEVMPVLPVPGM